MKYRNKPTVIDGLRFDSKAEARRWSELLLLERAGKISALERQVAFPIVIGGVKICKYIADFVYWQRGRNQRTVEDVKGVETDVFRLKAKLVKVCYGIDIEIVQ